MVFHAMPYFLQHFATNLVKTLKHGSLIKKLLVLRRSTSFHGFARDAILFATFCYKFGQNPKIWYCAQKVASFEDINKFSWLLKNTILFATFC